MGTPELEALKAQVADTKGKLDAAVGVIQTIKGALGSSDAPDLVQMTADLKASTDAFEAALEG